MDRIKPWVGWMQEFSNAGAGDAKYIINEERGKHTYPVIVTPLLPDDPKVGEVWAYGIQNSAREITGAPFVLNNEHVYVPSGHGSLLVEKLTRIPEAKTYRLVKPLISLTPDGDLCISVTAESKEAAAAQIVESLVEEVS